MEKIEVQMSCTDSNGHKHGVRTFIDDLSSSTDAQIDRLLSAIDHLKRTMVRSGIEAHSSDVEVEACNT